jgi:GNAT superfamily N-acetyltransferase
LSRKAYAAVRKLEATDLLDSFDCGQPALNDYLQRHAFGNQKANSAQTYVCCEADAGNTSSKVLGYYSLAVGSAEPADSPTRITQGLARHPVPVMLLARLAVDQQHQGKGLGRALLKDALLRTLQAADIAGIRALLVHAKDEATRQRYLQWDFDPSPTDAYHLYLLMKDLKGALE